MKEHPIIPKIFIDRGERLVCATCSAEVDGKCKLAQLEKDICRRPTVFDASREGVSITYIPGACPNEYKSPDNQEL